MKRATMEKSVLTLGMVAWYLLMPVTGYTDDSGLYEHVAYMFSHANIWHLAGNLFVLWIMRGRLYVLPSMVIAFLWSYLPCWGIWPIGMTVGFSGVLFAIAGIKWGAYCRSFAPAGRMFERLALEEFFMKALPFAVIGVIIPHINWCIHLYCMLVGFAYGRYVNRD